MKKLINNSMTLLFLLVIAACTQNNSIEDNFLNRRLARGSSSLMQNSVGAGVPVSPLEGKTWGEITGDLTAGIQSNAFQLAVSGLLGATLAPQEVGFVSSFPNDVTGIRFWGKIDLESGPLNAASIEATRVNLNTAVLRLAIWDSLSGTEDQNGNTIPEYSLSFTKAVSGTVSGNTATLVFEDSYGQVTLTGNFDQNFFQGQVSFQNSRSFNGAVTPQQGILGTFKVNTCGFFTCQ